MLIQRYVDVIIQVNYDFMFLIDMHLCSIPAVFFGKCIGSVRGIFIVQVLKEEDL